MRPPGEIRLQALQVVRDLALERQHTAVPGATWRDVAQRLVPMGMARRTVRFTMKNLVNGGFVQPVASVRVEGSARPLHAYAPAPDVAQHQQDRGASLCVITRAWAGST